MKNYNLTTKWFLLIFAFVISSSIIYSQEICDNGIDDDGDGFIDLLDSECTCGNITNNDSVPSLLPNSSFEEYSSCPFGWGSDSFVIGWWNDFTEPTTDYINTCNWLGPIASGTPLVNFPHGNGVMGTFILDGYKEYIGAQLSTPLIAGEEYTIQMFVGAMAITNETPAVISDSLPFVAPSLDITIFGSEGIIPPPNTLTINIFDCIDLPDWEEVTSMYYTPDEKWDIVTFTFVPQKSYRSLIIGSPCNLAPEYPTFPIPHNMARSYFVWDGIRINTPDQFGSHIEKTGALCTDDVMLTANIDTTGVSYQWYLNGIALVGETNQTLDATLYGAGDYSVVFNLGENCETRTIELLGAASDPMPSFNVTTDTLCSGIPQSLFASGNADYFSWSPNENLNVIGSGNEVIAMLDSTTLFTVTAYINGCPKDTTIEVVVIATPVLDLIPQDIMCKGEQYELIINMTNIDSLTWMYFQNPSELDYITQVNDSTYLLGHPHNYLHVITAYNESCTFTDTLYLIANNPLPIANGNILDDHGVAPLIINIENNTTNYLYNTYYIWDFGNGDSLLTASESTVSNTYNVAGVYEICLEALQTNYYDPTNQDVICSTKWCDTIVVIDSNDFNVTFPNVFTPNNDGVNDLFYPEINNIKSIQCSIVNRWGNVVAVIDDDHPNWDGSNFTEGVYFYTYNAVTLSDIKITGEGFIHLIRE